VGGGDGLNAVLESGDDLRTGGRIWLNGKCMSLDELTDIQVTFAIAYLDPDSTGDREPGERAGDRKKSPVLAIWIALTILVLGGLTLFWLYGRLS